MTARPTAAERDRAVRFLGYHRDAGGLDDAGYADRVRRATAATTSHELDALFEDLSELTALPGAQHGELMRDLLALDDVVGPQPAGRLRAMSDRARAGTTQGWWITGAMALAWVAGNVMAFVAWFLVAMVTVDVEFWPRTVFVWSTILLAVCSCMVTRGYGLFGPRR